MTHQQPTPEPPLTDKERAAMDAQNLRNWRASEDQREQTEREWLDRTHMRRSTGRI